MTTHKEALTLALEALDDIKGDCSGCEFEWSNDYPLQAKAHAAIKEALAQPEQFPFKQLEEELTKIAELQDRIRLLEKQLSAQPEQEPVAWRVRWPKIGGGYAWVMNDAPLMAEHSFINEPLYTTPPQRKPLTDEQISDLWCEVSNTDFVTADTHEFARAIESAHGIKGDE